METTMCSINNNKQQQIQRQHRQQSDNNIGRQYYEQLQPGICFNNPPWSLQRLHGTAGSGNGDAHSHTIKHCCWQLQMDG